MNDYRYRTPLFLLLILTVVTLTGCSRKEPVKIGFLGGLSGRNAELGVAGLYGATLAIEKVNQAGGINGVPVQLVVKDDQQNPEVAVRQVEEFIKSGVSLVIGPMTSSMAAAVIPVANKAGLLLLSPTVTSSDFTGRDDHFIRICSDINEYAAKNAHFHSESLGKRRVSIIYDTANSAYSERWQAAYRKAFAKDDRRVVSTFTFSSETDKVFLATARKILATGPDLVLIIANPVDASSITQQLRKLRPNMAVSLAEWASSEKFIELTGIYAEGVHVSQFMNRNSDAETYLAFLDTYVQRFGMPPGHSAVAGYDAAMIAINALSGQAGHPQQAKEFIITRGRFQGLQEAITINRFGDSQRPTYLSVVRNGTYVTIE